MAKRPPLPSRLAPLEEIHGNPANGESEPLLIRWRDLSWIVGKTRSCIYRDMDLGKFPKPVKTSGHANGSGKRGTIAWRFSDLKAWAEQLPPVEFGDEQREAVE